MAEPLRLMCVLAHPDDESLGTGGVLARYSAEGVETHLVCATRGERGWQGDPKDDPGPDALGKIREAELRAAVDVLGVKDLQFIDYIDGDLDKANPSEAIGRIVTHIRRVKPHVVISFGPEGAYGHPDHIAISQYTVGALVCAADSAYADSSQPPFPVPKFYYKVWTQIEGQIYEQAFGKIVMPVDGVDRGDMAYPDWAITTRVDTRAYWQTVWQAVACHRSQLPGYAVLESLPVETQETLWGRQGFIRAYSTVNGGRKVETDLFEGLR